MKLKYVLIAILCLNNQTTKSHDEIIECAKITALSIGTALAYEFVQDIIATNYAPILHVKAPKHLDTIMNGVKAGILWSIPLIVFSRTDDRWPQINAEQLVIPAATPLIATEIVSLFEAYKTRNWLLKSLPEVPPYNEIKTRKDTTLYAIDIARDVSNICLIGYIINQRIFNK